MIAIELLAPSAVDWEALDAFADRTVFQTSAWLEFITATQGGEPVVLALREDGRLLGFFTGVIIRKWGMRILGSPFPGWTTAYMGCNLIPGAHRSEAIKAVVEFAFRELRCVHVEIMDRRVTVADTDGLDFDYEPFTGYEIDLTKGEDELLAGMSSACRRCIRKAAKSGVVIEEADDEAFADDYYSQLQDVFAKQALVPTYDVERVRRLIDTVRSSGMLLLLRARAPDGRCIATGIFPALNDLMYFWGGASHRDSQILRPNESLQWYAMRYWKARGISRYDMGGGGEYKRKYGGYEIAVPHLRKSRYRLLSLLRDGAARGFEMRQRLAGRGRRTVS